MPIRILYHPQCLKDWKDLSPSLQKKTKQKIYFFQKNPGDPHLKNHKLTGKLQNLWAFSITYDYRLIYFYTKEGEIVFLRIGRHKSVY